MGYMPIHCAASGGSLTLVKYFIELEIGVDVNIKTKVSFVKLNNCVIHVAYNLCKE